MLTQYLDIDPSVSFEHPPDHRAAGATRTDVRSILELVFGLKLDPPRHWAILGNRPQIRSCSWIWANRLARTPPVPASLPAEGSIAGRPGRPYLITILIFIS